MERLTKRMCGGWGLNDGCNLNTLDGMREVVDRLAAYEDTGLEPDEIAEVQAYLEPIPFGRFHAIMEAEKDGRLVVLPCKAGDVVWVIDDCVRDWPGKPLPYKCWVYGIEITGKRKRFHVECYRTKRDFPFDFDQAGKTVFLTREEAEAALKKREKEQQWD